MGGFVPILPTSAAGYAEELERWLRRAGRIATVGGRYYALASAEITRWLAPAWGLATFVDAGNAADEPRGLKPVYGYGVGVRVRTPIGPFRVDVAYGQESKQVRLHLSIGLTF